MPRFVAIAFSGLALEIARHRLLSEEGGKKGASEKEEPDEVFAVVVTRVARDEASLLGNTRLSEVSPEARKLGIGVSITPAATPTTEIAVITEITTCLRLARR